MIRLLFVVFVCLGGFAALALWNARDGDDQAMVDEVLSGEVATVFRAEMGRLDEHLAALIREDLPIGPEAAIHAKGAMDVDGSGSGGNSEAESIEPEPATSEPVRAEIVRSNSIDDTAPAVVHDVAPPSEFAQDLGGVIEIAAADDSAASDDTAPNEPLFTEATLDEAQRSADSAADSAESADLIRRMLAVYSRTHERR